MGSAWGQCTFRIHLPAAGEHLATQLPLSQPQQGQINQETLPMVLPVRHSRYQKMSLLLCGPGQPRPLGSNLAGKSDFWHNKMKDGHHYLQVIPFSQSAKILHSLFSLDELFTSHHCHSCLPCLSAPCHHSFHLHARSGDLLAAVQH